MTGLASRLALAGSVLSVAPCASAAQALRLELGASSDSESADIVRSALAWMPDYTDLDHFSGIKLERAAITPTGTPTHDTGRVYGLFAGGDAWKWNLALGSDGHRFLGSANLFSDADDRHREVFFERDIVGTTVGLSRGLYYSFIGATADLPLGPRDTLVGLAGWQSYDGNNDRLHLRGRYIHVVSEDWGLSVQMRARYFRDSDPHEFDYYSPHWYGEALGVLALRRWYGGWEFSGAIGNGRQRDDRRAWHAAHLAEMRITSPKRGAWYLDVHAVYTDTALGSGGGIGDASYAYRAFDVSLNRTW